MALEGPMNSCQQNHMTEQTSRPTRKQLRLFLLWGLILEGPVRYWVYPDPFVHPPEHWYFNQPVRLLIELGFVLLAGLPFFLFGTLKPLRSVRFDRRQRLYFALAILIPLAVFLTSEWPDVQAIGRLGLWGFVPIWAATGVLMGIGQELTFRGLIYTGVEGISGVRLGVSVSTLLFVFGPVHATYLYTFASQGYVSEAFQLLSIFFGVGLLFAWMRIRTRSILIPAIGHAVGNAVTWAVFVVKLHG